MLPNGPVNTDARASVVLCVAQWARAGYWKRWASLQVCI